jgi:hypothetical protein
VVVPVLKPLFAAILRQLGPKAPLSDGHALATWHFSADAAAFMHSLHTLCFDRAAGCPQERELFLSGLNKHAYWVWQISMYCSLLEQLWSPLMLRQEEPRLRALVLDAAVACATDFFVLRYMHGLAALQAEVGAEAWRQRRRHTGIAESPIGRTALALLRCSPGQCVYPAAGRRASEVLRRMWSDVAQQRKTA